jgi:hypothetical protein
MRRILIPVIRGARGYHEPPKILLLCGAQQRTPRYVIEELWRWGLLEACLDLEIRLDLPTSIFAQALAPCRESKPPLSSQRWDCRPLGCGPPSRRPAAPPGASASIRGPSFLTATPKGSLCCCYCCCCSAAAATANATATATTTGAATTTTATATTTTTTTA